MTPPRRMRASTATAIILPETPSGTNSDALRDSQLGRLPAEIRNVIYEMVLTHHHGIRCVRSSWAPMHDGTSVLQALSIMSTCKQIREETELLLFTLNDITSSEGPITHNNYRDRSEYTPMSTETVSLLNSIPVSLLSPRSRLVTWIPPDIAMDALAHHLRVARNLQHLQLSLGVILGRHRWCGCSDENGSDCQTNSLYDTSICSKDVPVSMNDCARIRLVFPVDDRSVALALVEDRYQAKVSMIETHGSHRICPVRVEFGKLLQSHKQVRRELVELVEGTFRQS